MIYHENLNHEIHILCADALRTARRKNECQTLAGIEEGNPYDVFVNEATRAIETLKYYIKEAEFLRDHICEWSEDGYCIYCGADGRA